MELELFHGTNNKQAQSICDQGPSLPKNAYPGDVGMGFYNFYEDNNRDYLYSKTAKDAAKIFANKYRNRPTAIVKTKVQFTEGEVLDLNNTQNYNKLVEFKNKSTEIINSKIQEYQQQHPKAAVSSRANPDGMAIERFMALLPKEPAIILWDRWEDIEDSNIRMHSGQLPNCEVAVVRDLDIIKEQSVV